VDFPTPPLSPRDAISFKENIKFIRQRQNFGEVEVRKSFEKKSSAAQTRQNFAAVEKSFDTSS